MWISDGIHNKSAEWLNLLSVCLSVPLSLLVSHLVNIWIWNVERRKCNLPLHRRDLHICQPLLFFFPWCCSFFFFPLLFWSVMEGWQPIQSCPNVPSSSFSFLFILSLFFSFFCCDESWINVSRWKTKLNKCALIHLLSCSTLLSLHVLFLYFLLATDRGMTGDDRRQPPVCPHPFFLYTSFPSSSLFFHSSFSCRSHPRLFLSVFQDGGMTDELAERQINNTDMPFFFQMISSLSFSLLGEGWRDNR